MTDPTARNFPRSLRASLMPEELAKREWCDAVWALGSYWHGPGDTDLQSQLVKYFKAPSPTPLETPCVLPIVRAYGEMISDMARDRDWRPNAIVRVLASSEKRPDPSRPHSLLARAILQALARLILSTCSFAPSRRRPMRIVDCLFGPEVLRRGINYVLQDLFITP